MIGEAVHERICLIARTSPASLGITASSTWSLSALRDHPPEHGRVICIDEFGPLNLQPRKGKAWRPTEAHRADCALPTTAGTV